MRLWRTNSANSYSLTVNNGTGGGNFGAGSILALTANPAPSGQFFAGWTGAVVTNAFSLTTMFVMPTNNVILTAVYSNVPSPIITSAQLSGGTTSFLLSAQGNPSQNWILQCSSNLFNWVDLSTNGADMTGLVQFTPPVDPAAPRQFYRLRSP